jgi:hypothetical protein
MLEDRQLYITSFVSMFFAEKFAIKLCPIFKLNSKLEA